MIWGNHSWCVLRRMQAKGYAPLSSQNMSDLPREVQNWTVKVDAKWTANKVRQK